MLRLPLNPTDQSCEVAGQGGPPQESTDENPQTRFRRKDGGPQVMEVLWFCILEEKILHEPERPQTVVPIYRHSGTHQNASHTLVVIAGPTLSTTTPWPGLTLGSQ